MIRQGIPQKNTHLKNTQANAEAIFLREYFFSSPRRNSTFIFNASKKIKTLDTQANNNATGQLHRTIL